MSDNASTHAPAPPLPTHGSLFSDQMAAAVMAAIEKLDEGLQHEILRLLRDRLHHPEARSGQEARQLARGVTALREAADLLLDAADDAGLAAAPKLAERVYKRLRAEHPERGWPAESSIRRVLGSGSWNAALRRAYLEVDDDGDTVGLDQREFGWKEMEAAVLECCEDLRAIGIADPDPNADTYLHWASRPNVASRPGRRPLSRAPFDRFGGFELCKRVMLAGTGPPSAEEIKQHGRGRQGGARFANRRRYAYTDSDLKAALIEVTEELGHAPKTIEYTTTRQMILDRAQAEGDQFKSLPHYNLINRRYRSWDHALEDAGLAPFFPPRLDGEGRAIPMAEGRNIKISDEEILAGIRGAYEVKGKPFTMRAYNDWREEQARRDAEGRRLAGYRTIIDRYRDAPVPWKAACDEALPADWMRSE